MEEEKASVLKKYVYIHVYKVCLYDELLTHEVFRGDLNKKPCMSFSLPCTETNVPRSFMVKVCFLSLLSPYLPALVQNKMLLLDKRILFPTQFPTACFPKPVPLMSTKEDLTSLRTALYFQPNDLNMK